MSSARRIFVLLFALLPLLAAQCWGLCGIPEKAQAEQQPCHHTPADKSAPEPAAPATCCTATAAIAISTDTDFNVSFDSAFVASSTYIYAAEFHMVDRWAAIPIHQPPLSPGLHAILRI